MRALQLVEWQHAPELREVPEPEAGPGEVVVRIAAAGACHSDLHLIHDFAPGLLPWHPPFTLGHENTGWVDQIGEGVRGLEVGQPVAIHGPWGCGLCARCRGGIENYCDHPERVDGAGGGLGRDGGMAEHMLVPSARHLVPLGSLDPVVAAPLTDAGLTPYHAVKRSLPRLGAGSHAVVIGTGGLGHLAVQLLESLTATTILAVDTRERALALATESGAHQTFLVGTDADALVADVRAATGGLGADVVLDFVGVDATMAFGARVARSLGDLTIVGIGGGTLPFTFFTTPYEVSVATTYWGSVTELMEVLALAEAGRLRPRVTTYPLDRAVDAYDAMRRGELDGRAVIVPG
jgi:propanol-preferring alcohol dehydrogenase